eukprot:7918940-Prorocentrum_lima.AAC.1
MRSSADQSALCASPPKLGERAENPLALAHEERELTSERDDAQLEAAREQVRRIREVSASPLE